MMVRFTMISAQWWARFCVFCLPIAGTTYAQSQVPVLENSFLRAAFDPAKGGLVSFVHKGSGVDLRSIQTGTLPLAWGMALTNSDGSQEISDSNRTLSFSFSRSSTGGSDMLTLTWHGFFTDKGTQHPNATIQLTV